MKIVRVVARPCHARDKRIIHRTAEYRTRNVEFRRALCSLFDIRYSLFDIRNSLHRMSFVLLHTSQVSHRSSFSSGQPMGIKLGGSLALPFQTLVHQIHVGLERHTRKTFKESREHYTFRYCIDTKPKSHHRQSLDPRPCLLALNQRVNYRVLFLLEKAPPRSEVGVS